MVPDHWLDRSIQAIRTFNANQDIDYRFCCQTRNSRASDMLNPGLEFAKDLFQFMPDPFE